MKQHMIQYPAENLSKLSFSLIRTGTMPEARSKSRERSNNTIEIGRGNHDDHGDLMSRPVRRVWEVNDQHAVDEDDDAVLNHKREFDVYEEMTRQRPRPQWLESSGNPIATIPDHGMPAHMMDYGTQSQSVATKQRPLPPTRSPGPPPPRPVHYDDEDEITTRKLRTFNGKPDPLIAPGGTPKAAHDSEHVPGNFQTIFDINHPQDATTHLELPITKDHEAELEAFSRLQRLGNFNAAQDYFKKKLEPFLSNPYIFRPIWPDAAG